MAQLHSKNSKRKYGLTPGYTPRLYSAPTEEAVIPLTQHNGDIKYISEHDLKWMIRNGQITEDGLKPKK